MPTSVHLLPVLLPLPPVPRHPIPTTWREEKPQMPLKKYYLKCWSRGIKDFNKYWFWFWWSWWRWRWWWSCNMRIRIWPLIGPHSDTSLLDCFLGSTLASGCTPVTNPPDSNQVWRIRTLVHLQKYSFVHPCFWLYTKKSPPAQWISVGVWSKKQTFIYMV